MSVYANRRAGVVPGSDEAFEALWKRLRRAHGPRGIHQLVTAVMAAESTVETVASEAVSVPAGTVAR